MSAEWKVTHLGAVCEYLNRGISPQYVEEGGLIVLNQKCIRDHRINFRLARRHDNQVKAVGRDRLIQIGDVLVNSTGTGTLGRVAQLREAPTEPTTVDSHVTIVRPQKSFFNANFFGYMMVSIETEIAASGDGCGGQTELSRSVLAERFTVRFPVSIPEQQRIVAILDEAFAAIATAKANAEKNLQNARALFDSYLASCFSVWHDTWPKESIGSVCEYSNGKAHEMHIDEGGQFILINSKFISSDGQVFKRTSAPLSLLRIGDVAMVLSDVPNGKALAKCYLVESNETYSLNQRICSFRSKVLIPRFLYWQLNRHPYLLSFDNGENQTNLRLNQVLSCPLVVPPLHVQQSLADTLDSIAEKVEALKGIFEGKLAALDELKKSLLHRAFNGDL